MADLSVAFDGDVVDIVINRKAGTGTTVKGKFTPDAVVPIQAKAAVIPTPLGTKKLVNPEGNRKADYKNFYTETQLQHDDIIVYGGRNYEILNIEDWIAQAGYCLAVTSSTDQIK